MSSSTTISLISTNLILLKKSPILIPLCSSSCSSDSTLRNLNPIPLFHYSCRHNHHAISSSISLLNMRNKAYCFHPQPNTTSNFMKTNSTSWHLVCHYDYDTPGRTPPEIPTPTTPEEPYSFPTEVPVIDTPPELDPIPPEKVAEPPPFTPGPDLPDPDFPSPPIPSPPAPDIPLPPPDIWPPQPPDDIPPRPPGIVPPPSTPPDIMPPPPSTPPTTGPFGSIKM